MLVYCTNEAVRMCAYIKKISSMHAHTHAGHFTCMHVYNVHASMYYIFIILITLKQLPLSTDPEAFNYVWHYHARMFML